MLITKTSGGLFCSLPPSFLHFSVLSPFLPPSSFYPVSHFLSSSFSFFQPRRPSPFLVEEAFRLVEEADRSGTACMPSEARLDQGPSVGRLIKTWAPALGTALLSRLCQHQRQPWWSCVGQRNCGDCCWRFSFSNRRWIGKQVDSICPEHSGVLYRIKCL